MPKLSPRKALAEAAVSRITNTGAQGKTAEKMARNMFIGASNMALIIGDKELAHDIHSAFTDIVEQGLKKLYAMAEIDMPVVTTQTPEVTTNKEAA